MGGNERRKLLRKLFNFINVIIITAATAAITKAN